MKAVEDYTGVGLFGPGQETLFVALDQTHRPVDIGESLFVIGGPHFSRYGPDN